MCTVSGVRDVTQNADREGFDIVVAVLLWLYLPLNERIIIKLVSVDRIHLAQDKEILKDCCKHSNELFFYFIFSYFFYIHLSVCHYHKTHITVLQ